MNLGKPPFQSYISRSQVFQLLQEMTEIRVLGTLSSWDFSQLGLLSLDVCASALEAAVLLTSLSLPTSTLGIGLFSPKRWTFCALCLMLLTRLRDGGEERPGNSRPSRSGSRLASAPRSSSFSTLRQFGRSHIHLPSLWPAAHPSAFARAGLRSSLARISQHAPPIL